VEDSYHRDRIANRQLHPETLMMGYGYAPGLSEGSLKPPIFLTSTFVFENAQQGKDFFDLTSGRRQPRPGEKSGLVYSRFNNPNLEILEDRLAIWDQAERSAVFASVHVEDLVAAILAALDNPLTGNKLYNICMDEPVDYGAVAAYLKETRGLDCLDIPSNYHSNWMDNSRAKFELEWRPRYDLARLIDAAWIHRRSPDDPRKVWYPG
jgi:Cys/Met metabolism PLP-dependent enzyme